MDIVMNGKLRHVSTGTSISQLLETEGLAGRRVAVEVNGEIVPGSRHDGHALNQGDKVEIVHALGGG